MTTRLFFWKMHGAGNDFVVLDALSNALLEGFDFSSAVRLLCARNFHVGGDGLLLLDQPDTTARNEGAAVRMQMWNPDGSEDMCGNGLRCIAHLAHRQGHASTRDFIVQTLAGLRAVEMLPGNQVRTAMGEPQFDMEAIPMRPPAPASIPGGRAIDYTLNVAGQSVPHVTTLSTGSTHSIIFTDQAVDDATFRHLSPLIEHHAWFPARTSVMWAHLTGANHLRLRIWERGAGETLACGTGACAAAVAAHITERCGSEVAVESRGGTLRIQWQPGRQMWMTGPAQVVFAGSASL